jgi:hypothetical protein
MTRQKPVSGNQLFTESPQANDFGAYSKLPAQGVQRKKSLRLGMSCGPSEMLKEY